VPIYRPDQMHAYADQCTAAAQARIAELEKALSDAAKSLNTIATRSGNDEYLSDMTSVRGYAFNRCNVARAALASRDAELAKLRQGEPVALPRRGLIVLKNAVQMLREQARFVDEEGDDTSALEELLDALASPPPSQPPVSAQVVEALELIAAPMRPDGTWNRDREACRQIAAEALGRYGDDQAQPAPPSAVERDAVRLDWLMRHVPGRALRPLIGVMAWSGDIDEFRAAIDAAAGKGEAPATPQEKQE
jgi:hypothetical protein